MCEPHHSIVQYHLNDDVIGGSSESMLARGLGRTLSWGKKIGSFFHFSNLGSGHTESIEWAKTKELFLPQDTRYEAQWWHRRFHVDGPCRMPYLLKDEAKDHARQYAGAVCLDSIQSFRRFFEESVKQTDRPHLYLERMLGSMFTRTARDQVFLKLVRTFKIKNLSSVRTHQKNQIASMLLGYTRKRELLVPEWADEPHIWIAGK